MNKFLLRLVLMICFPVAALACGRGPAMSPAPPPTIKPVVDGASRLTAQTRWEDLVAAARKEGTLTVAHSAGPQVTNPLKESFRKKFGIELEMTVGRADAQFEKISTERRAGLRTTDIYGLGGTTQTMLFKPAGFLSPLEPVLVLPEVTNPLAWKGGKLPYLDQDRTVFAPIGMYYRGILVNTDIVKKGQITSIFDLLKPEWKGKMLMDDISQTGAGGVWLGHVAEIFDYDLDKLRKYLSDLVAQQPVIIRDRRVAVEWVARGKNPILIGVSYSVAPDFKGKGAPIDIVPVKESTYVSTTTGAISLPEGELPHPNSAIVYINWLLGQEGQTVLAQGYGSPSLRVDVPTAGMDPMLLEIPGEKLIYENEKSMQTRPRLMQIAKEVLQPLLK
ncbi:MAG: ABC transporter substrate-binding protein [Chloroflexi bacterium]|nr:ABC transporter substrate-binding protein [Chloroflexota bacterium]